MKKNLLALALLATYCFAESQNVYWSGTNTWNTTTSNKDWSTSSTCPPTCSGTAFTSGNTANFEGTAGTVTLGASLSAANSLFSVTGYVLTQSAAYTLTSPIALSANVNLSLMPGVTTTYGQAGSISGPSTSSVSLNGSTLTGSNVNRINMSTNSTSIGVPVSITMGTLPATSVGFVATGTGITTSAAAVITLNGVRGQGRAMLGATSGNALTLNGQVTGTGDIQFSAGGTGGAGTVTYANTSNNFTGDLYMVGATSGTVQASAGAGSCVPSGTGVYYPTNGEGGVFDINGSNVTIAALSQTNSGAVGGVTNNGAASTLTVNQSGTTSFGLIISNGSVTKTTALTLGGSGNITLSAVNTYTGATNINSGALYLTGSLAAGSAVGVASGATIGGTGTANGLLTLTGTISPGATGSGSEGNLTTGAQTWVNGAIYNCDIAAATGTAGTNWDLVTSPSTITFPASGTITLNVSGTGITGFSNTVASTWQIFSASSFVNFNASNITLNISGFPAYTGTFSITNPSAGVIDLVYTPNAPVLVAAPASLSGFSAISGTASASQSFSLSGSNLNGGALTVTAPTGFEVSLDNSTFYSSVNPAYTGSTLIATTIYVRITSSASLGAQSGNVTNAGGGATTVNVTLTGTVLAAPPTIQATAISFSAVTSAGFTVSWTNGNGSARIVVVRPTSATNVVPTNATAYGANTVYGTGSTTGTNNYVVFNGTTGPVVVTGLASSTAYTVEVYEFNGGVGNQNYLTTTASGNPAAQTTLTPAYYWNGATPTSGAGVTANGGTGTWSTTNAWVEPSNPGTGATWANNSAAIVAGTAGTITLSGSETASSVAVNTTGYTLTSSATATLTAPVTLGTGVNLILAPDDANTFTQAGSITGGTGSSLTLSGTTLTGTNYVRINMSTASTGISAPMTINMIGSGATTLTDLVATASGISFAEIALNGTVGGGRIGLGATSGNSLTLNGAVTGTGDIQFSAGTTGGAGVLTFANTGNNFTGNLYLAGAAGADIQAGTGGNNCIPSTMGLYYATASQGGIFDLNGCNVSIAELSQTQTSAIGSITNNGASGTNTLTVTQSATTSYSLAITDGANAKTALTMAGTGALTLKGTASTYTGPTNVNSGSLFINGSGSLVAASAVTVASGAILGGSSSANGPIALSGTLSPGTTGSGAIGTFTTGAEIWATGASYQCDITAATGTAGTNWDLVTSSGAVDVSAGGYTLNINGTGITGFTNLGSYTWKILGATSVTGFNASNFTISTSGFPTYSGTFSVTSTGTEIDLVYTAPSAGLQVTPTSLTGFTTTSGTVSTSQSYVLSGANLDGTDVIVTAPAGYEISLDNSTFSASLDLVSGTQPTYTIPTLSNTTIYVRIAASAAPTSSLTGMVTNVGGSAANVNESLTGKVYAVAPATQATNVIFSTVGANSFTVNWTNGNGASRIAVIRLSSTANGVPTNYANYTANTAFGSGSTTGAANYVIYNGSGTGPVTVTGLAGNTSYTVEVYEYNGGTSVEAYNSTTATGNPNSQTTLTPDFYWNGTTPASTTETGGGPNNWNTTTTDWLTAATAGTVTAWPSSGIGNAHFDVTGGTVTTANATITAANSIFTVTGYNLICGGTSQQLNSPILLSGNNISLGLNNNSNSDFYQSGNITASGTNDNVVLSGTALSGSNNASQVALVGNGMTVSVPTIINLGTTDNTNLVGYTTKAVGVTVAGAITINGTIGDCRAMFGCTSGNTVNYTAQITGTGDLQFSNGASGGAGILTLSNTSNNFNGNLYMVGATSGKFQASAGAGSCVPSTMALYYATASQGGVFDLNGSDVTISALSQTSATATGSITNSGSGTGTNTLTVNQAANTTFGPLIITNGSTALTALTKSGSGTLTMIDLNTFTGPLTLTGGTIQMGASGNIFNNSMPVVFNGGTFSTGVTTGYSETVGTLQVNANSIISLGTGSHTLTFANSSAITWTAGTKLVINNWTGTVGNSGTAGKIFAGSDATGLTTAQLSQISFTGYGDGAEILSTGEIVPTSTYTWVGATSSDWETISNWDKNALPSGCSQDVVIPSGTTFAPVISNSSPSIGHLTMNSGASLTIASGYTLSVCKSVTGGGGSHAAVSGGGVLVLNGTGVQNISGNLRVAELNVTNSNGIVMQSGSKLNIDTALDLQTGNFDATNGTLIFNSSSATQSAIINNFSSGFAGTFTGSITANRTYATSSTYDQHYMGSPVNAPALTQFGASGTPGFVTPTGTCSESALLQTSDYGTVFSMHESNGATCAMAVWKVETTGNAQNGLGYSVLESGAGTLSLTGTANLNTSYTVSNLSNSGWANSTLQGRNYSSGWQLVSNPYLATLNVTTTNSGFDNQIQVWNANGPFAGSYQPSNVIAPFQAFMVHMTSTGTGGSYTINASDRVVTPHTFYSLTGNQLNVVAQNTGTGLMDQTTIGFSSAATDSFDNQIDADKIPGALNRHTIYSVNNGKWLAKNILNSIATTAAVAVGFEPGATGTYTLTFNGINTFDATSYITLEDTKLNIFSNVRNGAYTFDADSADGWNRFVLHFTPPAEVNTTTASCSNPGTINIQQPGTANWNYVLTDSNNVIVASGVLNQSSPVTVSAAAGTYTLTLVDGNNYIATKVISVAGSNPISASFSCSANSISQNNTVTLNSTSTDAATYVWSFGNGTTGTGQTTTASYQAPGVYSVELTVTDISGCSSSTSHNITVTANTTGINQQNESNSINIYSSGDKVYVDFTQLQNVDAIVTIYNILGQRLSSDHCVSNNIYQKEISGTDAAYLLVSVKQQDEITTKKVFVSKD